MDRALSYLNVLPSNKEEIEKFVAKAKREITSGKDDPLKILKQIKMIEKTLATILEDREIRNLFIDEALKHGNSFDFENTHFEVKESGVKYDYTVCHDSEWNGHNAECERITKKRKEREAFLQKIPLEGTVNPLTGELIYRPGKTSTTVVAVKL